MSARGRKERRREQEEVKMEVNVLVMMTMDTLEAVRARLGSLAPNILPTRVDAAIPIACILFISEL